MDIQKHFDQRAAQQLLNQRRVQGGAAQPVDEEVIRVALGLRPWDDFALDAYASLLGTRFKTPAKDIVEDIQRQRGTGRTTQAVVTCLTHVANGRKVLCSGRSKAIARELHRQAQLAARQLGLDSKALSLASQDQDELEPEYVVVHDLS